MSLKNSLIVLWVYIMYVLGLWIFLSGYLLKRIVVHQNSTSSVNIEVNIDCSNITSLNRISGDFMNELSTSSPKNYIHRFDKAVIIIIDALRYDFVKNFDVANEQREFYNNKMPVFAEYVEKYPQNSLLFELTADPPTTTLQRLKGLTTGSLPTFIDVSLNFASSEIMEDNIIKQMKAHNKRIVFMGDDTWENLFPQQFHRSFPYPSFNVKDLDTVDYGILDHIYEELEKNDSDIIIAHFLGVDHCGHRYGPRHPEMTRKLMQMNSVIQNVTEKLNHNAILFVLGDHGMTESGDHGGDSSQEVSTALFIYSPSKIIWNVPVKKFPSVAQVDIVPTVSLLLGLPIPFSNLGSALPQLFSLNIKQVCFSEELDPLIGSALAVMENSMQVQRYLQTYSTVSNELSRTFVTTAEGKLKKLSLLWNNITYNPDENEKVLLEIFEGYRAYLQYVRNVCAKKWATFNTEFMALGTAILCFTVSCNFWIAEQLNYKYFVIILCSILFVSSLLTVYLFSTVSVWLPVTVILFCIAGKYIKTFLEDFIHSWLKAINAPTIIMVLLFCASFSNSFVIHEDYAILYLLQSIIAYRFYPCILDPFKFYFQSTSIKAKTMKRNLKMNLKYIQQPLLLMCLMLCARLGTLFYKCREEQIPCENSDFIVPLEKLHLHQSYKVARLVVSLVSIIIPVVAFLGVISYKSTMKSQTVTAVCIKYGIFFVYVCTSLRWWLNIVAPDAVDRILQGNEVILTRAASLINIIMCIIICSFPMLAEKPWEVPSKEVYCGSLGSFLFIILQMLYLIAGDALAPAVLLMSLSIILHICLIDFSTNITETQLWVDVVTWNLLSRHWFYATAHQTTFTTIHWDAAFLLNHKEVYSYTLSGLLVLLNTFSSYILHGLALPLILTWSQPSTCTSRSLLRLHMKYLFCSAIRLTGTVLASVILRRHLMVWKIFSPKLLYEVLGMFVTMISVSISHCFMTKVTSQYHNLIRMNLSHMFTSKDQ